MQKFDASKAAEPGSYSKGSDKGVELRQQGLELMQQGCTRGPSHIVSG
jgi:hypothetical protein